MKKIVLLSLIFLKSYSFFAQDTIIKRDSSKILAKVIEIDIDKIRYKKAENINGPDYLILIALVKEIHFSNGYIEKMKEDTGYFTEYNTATKKARDVSDKKIYSQYPHFSYNGYYLNQRELFSFLMNSHLPDVKLNGQKAKSCMKKQHNLGKATLGFAVGAAGCFFAYTGLRGEYDAQLVVSSFGILSGFVSLGCLIGSAKYKTKKDFHTKEAIKLYNQQF